MRPRWLAAAAPGLALACGLAGATPAAKGGFAPTDCPPSVAAIAACHLVRDDNGAWVLAAIPKRWNQALVVHAHGGPRLSPPDAKDGLEDLDRHAAMVREGYAWVGSTYRRGGYGVRVAASDVENSRRLFVSAFGPPRRTLLHGQSWGGNVAAKLAELDALDAEGRPRYHAVLTTNGVLFGGTRAYGFRADLRAVYQYYCMNHPAPGEPAYPLWQGLPAASTMDRAELERRVHACTDLDRPAAKRRPEPAARLRDILAVTGVREDTLVSHLAWGTFHFRDLVQRHLGGGNPFDNLRTRYRGSGDDDALNAGIERFAADPAALARLAYDADLSGLIVLPTLTVHAIGDPVVSPTAQDAYASTVAAVGRAHLLAQVRTDERDHSRLQDATIKTALRALEAWLEHGARPDAARMQKDCVERAADPAACRFILQTGSPARSS
ncbi:MAG: hypothetical protein LW860_05660 [Xanthomonadaceae bacterium]|jgi:hypothetical protein|nr:hypothetical protein [Xanthomonadaceae bacterium]